MAHVEDAIHWEPRFGPAFVGLGLAYSDLGRVFIGASPLETRRKVLAAAKKALELDPELVEAHVVLASALQKEWRWAEAETEYKQAIELSPSDASARNGFSEWLLCQGQTEEALASARRAQELDPLAFDGAQVGWILFQSRRYAQAIRELRNGFALAP